MGGVGCQEGNLGEGVEGKQEQVTELGELVIYVFYQQVPLSRMTTTFCLFSSYHLPNCHLYLSKYEAE